MNTRHESRPVRFLRWPAEERLRCHYKKQHVPRLLVVEGGALPPACIDIDEDWVRAPISRQDLEARVQGLYQRVSGQSVPTLDPSGVLMFNGRSVTLSNAQVELMELLLSGSGKVVYRQELDDRLAEFLPNPTRNAMDLHIMRLRRRVAELGIEIHTARGRGYRLEPVPPQGRTA